MNVGDVVVLKSTDLKMKGSIPFLVITAIKEDSLIAVTSSEYGIKRLETIELPIACFEEVNELWRTRKETCLRESKTTEEEGIETMIDFFKYKNGFDSGLSEVSCQEKKEVDTFDQP